MSPNNTGLDKLTNVLLSSPVSPAASRGATIGVISEVIRIPTNKNSHIKIFQNQNIFHEEWNQAGFSIDGKCEVPWDYSSYSETLNFYSPILFGVELFIVQNIQPTFLIISTLCPLLPRHSNLTWPSRPHPWSLVDQTDKFNLIDSCQLVKYARYPVKPPWDKPDLGPGTYVAFLAWLVFAGGDCWPL